MNFSTRFLAASASLLLAGVLAASCTYSKGKDADAVAPCGVSAAAPATYAAVVRPILENHCLNCHGAANYVRQGASFNFDDFAVLRARALDGSLVRAVDWNSSTAPESRMPRPASEATRLSACDVARITTWVQAGAQQN